MQSRKEDFITAWSLFRTQEEFSGTMSPLFYEVKTYSALLRDSFSYLSLIMYQIQKSYDSCK